MQHYLNGQNYKEVIHKELTKDQLTTALLVCGHSGEKLEIFQWIRDEMEMLGGRVFMFQDFHPNPTYEMIEAGIKCYSEHHCDVIFAIGGGSTIDVAKCIKIGLKMERRDEKTAMSYDVQGAPLIVAPTTAGSGSEATRFAVIYYRGEKVSVTHPDTLPSCVVMDERNLFTLPVYQRRATVLDALSHGIESLWAIRSTEESCRYAEHSVCSIIQNMERYVRGEGAERPILLAANEAGKAINISKTTAAHAMCYKLTTLFQIPHGRAVMLCLPELWEYMYLHMEKCVDVRGKDFLKQRFWRIAESLGYQTVEDAVGYLKLLRREWNMDFCCDLEERELERLVSTVNVERLNNNPVKLSKEDIRCLYKNILGNNAQVP